MEVLIVGAGAMGEWFARLFKRWGWEVWVTDADERKARRVSERLGVKFGREVLTRADVVLVAVPISSTPSVLEEVGARMKRGSLLMEVASVKEQTVAGMQRLKSAQLELVALHPLFGPGASELRGERFAFIPVRAGRIFEQVRERLEAEGARLFKTDWREHDQKMARVQALSHLILLLYLKLCERGELQTRLSRSLAEVAKALLAGNPSVYYDIQTLNRYSATVRGELIETLKQLDGLLREGKKEEFEEIFRRLAREFGKEVEEAYRRLYVS
ncbi:MAG: prephenate dehydrogenase/arogenate dehydrogenase family protein [Candidatus Hadarchaeales archaeon]